MVYLATSSSMTNSFSESDFSVPSSASSSSSSSSSSSFRRSKKSQKLNHRRIGKLSTTMSTMGTILTLSSNLELTTTVLADSIVSSHDDHPSTTFEKQKGTLSNLHKNIAASQSQLSLALCHYYKGDVPDYVSNIVSYIPSFLGGNLGTASSGTSSKSESESGSSDTNKNSIVCPTFRNPISANEDSADPKVANLAKWMNNYCLNEADIGLDNIFIGDFRKETLSPPDDNIEGDDGKKTNIWVRGIGFTKDFPSNTFFMCLPRRCWFGPSTMPKRYSWLQTRHPDQCETVQYVTSLWMADEIRKREKSRWRHFLETLPTVDDYSRYHPAMARVSGPRALSKCVQKIRKGYKGDYSFKDGGHEDNREDKNDILVELPEDLIPSGGTMSEIENLPVASHVSEEEEVSDISDSSNTAVSESTSFVNYRSISEDQAVDLKLCKPAWEPIGDAFSYWEAWYNWLGDCHNKYLEEYWVGKRIEEEIEKNNKDIEFKINEIKSKPESQLKGTVTSVDSEESLTTLSVEAKEQIKKLKTNLLKVQNSKIPKNFPKAILDEIYKELKSNPQISGADPQIGSNPDQPLVLLDDVEDTYDDQGHLKPKVHPLKPGEEFYYVPKNEKGRDRITGNESSGTIDFEGLLKHAYVLVMTRDFADVGNMPLMDLPNTDIEYNSHQYWYDKSRDTFCLMTERDVKAGEEVNVNYSHSTKDPYIMFAQYAFAFPHGHPKASRMLCKGLTRNDPSGKLNPKNAIGNSGSDSTSTSTGAYEDGKYDVYLRQNGVATNFAQFAKRFCRENDLKVEEEDRRKRKEEQLKKYRAIKQQEAMALDELDDEPESSEKEDL